MSMRTTFLCLLGLILWSSSVVWADDDDVADGVLAGKLLLKLATDEAPYRIGVAVEPAKDGNGLVVTEVLPDSPAAKAGLKSGDVILATGDGMMKSVEQLAKSVADSQGRPLVLVLSHEGEGKRVIAVTPEKQRVLAITEEGEDNEGKGANPGIARPRLRAVEARPVPPAPAQPGASRAMARMAGGMPPMAQLPDDMEVKISKQGNKPAVIKVKQGVKSWKTTENELGMLPQPAQAYAARALGRPMMGMMPGAPYPGGQQPGAQERFEWRLGGEKPGANPGGGFRIELKEADEKKASPQNPATGKGAEFKVVPGGGIEIRIGEGEESPSDKPATERAAAEKAAAIQRLKAHEDELRRALEELRKAVREKQD